MNPNSITAELSASHLANEVGIVGKAGREPVILVEGPSDKATYSQFFIIGPEQMIPAFGKPLLLAAVQECARRKLSFVVGIVDVDEETRELSAMDPVSGTGLVTTGVRDADVLVLTTPRVCARILENWADEALLPAGTWHDRAHFFIGEALRLSRPAGCLRRESIKQGWNLRLEHIPFGILLDSECQLLNESMLVELCVRKTHRTEPLADLLPLIARIDQHMSALAVEILDERLVCRGHDVAAVASLLLQRRFGAGQSLGQGNIERVGRSIFAMQDFEVTQLCAALRVWETSTQRTILAQTA